MKKNQMTPHYMFAESEVTDHTHIHGYNNDHQILQIFHLQVIKIIGSTGDLEELGDQKWQIGQQIGSTFLCLGSTSSCVSDIKEMMPHLPIGKVTFVVSEAKNCH